MIVRLSENALTSLLNVSRLSFKFRRAPCHLLDVHLALFFLLPRSRSERISTSSTRSGPKRPAVATGGADSLGYLAFEPIDRRLK